MQRKAKKYIYKEKGDFICFCFQAESPDHQLLVRLRFGSRALLPLYLVTVGPVPIRRYTSCNRILIKIINDLFVVIFR